MPISILKFKWPPFGQFWSGSLAYKTTLEKQYFIVSEPKVEVISSKIGRVAAIYTSKFKWAWRAQFLSHTLQILEKVIFFEDLQEILLSFLEIFIITKVTKNAPSLSVQV